MANQEKPFLKACPLCASGHISVIPFYALDGEFLGHRVQCENCGLNIAHRAIGETFDLSVKRAALLWNTRHDASIPLQERIKPNVIPVSEIPREMPPEGIVRYILQTQQVSFDEFAKEIGLDKDSFAERLNYLTLETAEWLSETIGYDLTFWKQQDENGDRSIRADWRRWLRCG